MKNIQVAGYWWAENCVYDIFQATEAEFDQIFQNGIDILFSDEIVNSEEINNIFKNIWERRILKNKAMGIHGTIFYELSHEKLIWALGVNFFVKD